MPFVTDRHPCLQYDGTNSTAILDMVGSDFELVSETGGVLVFWNPNDPMYQHTVNTGDYVIAVSAVGNLRQVVSPEQFAQLYLVIAEA
jgi:hypothetical protein